VRQGSRSTGRDGLSKSDLKGGGGGGEREEVKRNYAVPKRPNLLTLKERKNRVEAFSIEERASNDAS